uniref:hypothetical protein n=2 Tax=unclassified Streptomyces TaxID=2593676 RepID=UPI003C7C9C47
MRSKRLVESRRRIPEHVRAVHHGHVLRPHLLDQRVMRRKRDPLTVRRRDVEHIMITGERTPLTIPPRPVDHPVPDEEPVLRLQTRHLPGKLMELRRPLIETRQDPVPIPLRNNPHIRQNRLEITHQPDNRGISTQKDIDVIDRLRLDLRRLRQRTRLEPLRSKRIRRPHIDDHIPVPRQITELLEPLLRHPVRMTRRIRI